MENPQINRLIYTTMNDNPVLPGGDRYNLGEAGPVLGVGDVGLGRGRHSRGGAKKPLQNKEKITNHVISLNSVLEISLAS